MFPLSAFKESKKKQVDFSFNLYNCTKQGCLREERKDREISPDLIKKLSPTANYNNFKLSLGNNIICLINSS